MTTKTRITILFAAICITLSGFARPETTDSLFRHALAAVKDPEKTFRTDGSWFPYPAYSDRNGWEELSHDFRLQLIARGEEWLDHVWYAIPASKYLEYEKTGNRAIFTPEEQNLTALKELVLAELTEGKGRFLNQILDALWFYAQKWTWSHPQHTRYQKSGRAIPVFDERPVTYHSSATGACIALAWHFFHEAFDEMDPSISAAVKDAVRRNIFIPYMDDEQVGQSWQGFEPVRLLNNHTTNENLHCTLCFLLMEEDRQRLTEALKRSVEIEDKYIAYIKHDGACEEGSAYWKASFGKVYQYCRMLHDFSDGRIDLFDNELIRKMGEFKALAYLGKGYHMNYGDGAVRDYVSPALLYRFGKDTHSKLLKNFALYLMIEERDRFDNRNLPNKPADLYLGLETMRYERWLTNDQQAALENADNNLDVLRRQLKCTESAWYPETEYAIFRNDNDWVLTAKGAFNDESHNHNDVGSGMLYIESMPVLIDPGIGIYNKNTFGENRYSEWCMRSDWHNIPMINGEMQQYGARYKALNATCDIRRKTFSAEIQEAYAPEAACRKWVRSYELTNSSVTIVDSYDLLARKAPDTIHFVVCGDVTLTDGDLVITTYDRKRDRSLSVKVQYDPALTPVLTEMSLAKDSKLKSNWNSVKLTRIGFSSAEDAPTSGSYTFIFTRHGKK